MLRTMLDYNYKYQWLVWDSIMLLTDDQFITELPYSYGSIRNHMVHLATNDGSWLRSLKEEPNSRKYGFAPEAYTTRAAIRQICQQSADEVLAYAASLTEADLQRQPKNMPLNIWQTLFHLVNHGTDHRAQVLRALHDFGAPTFEQDFAFYVIKG
jgi:uncharacterized damage-inducible protein DinB